MFAVAAHGRIQTAAERLTDHLDYVPERVAPPVTLTGPVRGAGAEQPSGRNAIKSRSRPQFTRYAGSCLYFDDDEVLEPLREAAHLARVEAVPYAALMDRLAPGKPTREESARVC